MDLQNSRSIRVAVWNLTLFLVCLVPASAQDIAPGNPQATLCSTESSALFPSEVLAPAPGEAQTTCGPCILDTCAAENVRCSFVGCGLNDCCEYSCVCDPTCTSGNIPGGSCPMRLPICMACGDGDLDIGEDCDGTDLNHQTCESLDFHAGTLSCNGDCTFNTDLCVDQPVCGNDICEWGEDCETCSNDCEGQSTGKPSNRFCCGNGILEPAEGNGSICDGNP